DMLETDIHATRDGLALAVHDEDLLRIAGDPRRIEALSAAEAGAVRLAGDEPLAMLEDVLGSFPDVPVNIDVKTPTAIGPAVAADVVRKALATLHAATGITAVRSPSRGVIGQFVAARAVEAPNAVISRLLAPYGALQVPLSHRGVQIVTEANVAAAHRAGCEV